MNLIKFLSVAAVVNAGPAEAAIVTFDALIGPDSREVASGYVEAGLIFLMPGGSGQAMAVWGSANPFNAQPGGATLFPSTGPTLIVRREDGSDFDLDSFDLGDIYNQGGTGYIDFVVTRGGVVESQVLRLDFKKGLERFNLGLKGVSEFSLRYNPSFQIDNIRFDNAAGTVPEPANWAMLIAGFGLTGAVMRRRRLAVVSA